MPDGPEREAKAREVEQNKHIFDELVAQYQHYYNNAGRIIESASRMINADREASAMEDKGRAALINAMSTPAPTEINVHYSPY
jgi:hypothetical protein